MTTRRKPSKKERRRLRREAARYGFDNLGDYLDWRKAGSPTRREGDR